MDAGLALDPVVNAAGKRHHLLLGRLHTQRHTPPRHRARGCGDDLVGQGPQARVKDQLLVPLVDRLVRGVGEKSLQVKEKHSPGPAEPSIVPPQLFSQSVIGPVQALLLLGGPVVVDHTGVIQRDQRLVAQDFVDLPVRNVRGVDGPHLAPFPQGEMVALHGLPRSRQDFPSPAGRPGKQMVFKVLRTLFPAHPITAFQPIKEHLPIGEDILKATDRCTPSDLPCLPLCLPALVSCLAAFLACHIVIRTSVQMWCRMPSNLLCPGT